MRLIQKAFILLFLVSVTLCCFTSCKKDSERSLYDLSIEYCEGVIEGKLSYRFVNSYDTTFDRLVFNLHANAYKQDAVHRPVSSTTEARAYPNGISYGNITVNEVLVENESADYEIYGEDCQFLKIPIGEVKSNGTANVVINFTTVLPDSTLRLGKTPVGVNLADFFPTACKIEEGKFKEINYSAIGDPYCSDPHDYKVDVTVPSEYSVASSGFPTLTVVDGVCTTYSYELSKGRDFALALSKNYRVFCKTQNDVTFTYYGFSDDGEQLLNQMIDCVKYYSEAFGEFPYKSLSLAECDFVFGGMEYSGLCFINYDLPKEDKMQVIAHEVAHEWWHCAVGNDQNQSAYLDEGLAEYSTYLYMLSTDESLANEYVSSAKLAYKSFFNVEETISGKADTSMERQLSSFKSEYEYANLAYNKALLMFYEYGKAVGEDKAVKALSSLYKEYSFKDLTLQGLISALGYGEHFNSFVFGNVLI